MVFNHNNFPKPAGATDWMDSAHLAGMMALVKHPAMSSDLIRKYVVYVDGQLKGVRCPEDASGLCPANPNNFTRDQLIPLVAGLYKMGRQDEVKALLRLAIDSHYRAQNIEKDVPGSVKRFPDGADILLPSHINHLRICSGIKPKLLGKFILCLQVVINGIFTPMSEPNNLIAMCYVAGPSYIKFLKLTNPNINKAVEEYWSGWRGESELASSINSLLSCIKNI